MGGISYLFTVADEKKRELIKPMKGNTHKKFTFYAIHLYRMYISQADCFSNMFTIFSFTVFGHSIAGYMDLLTCCRTNGTQHIGYVYLCYFHLGYLHFVAAVEGRCSKEFLVRLNSFSQ